MSVDILKLTERIDIAREVGESHFREFKSAWAGRPSEKTPRSWRDIATDISDTLVGFTNADGGEIIIGLEDNGDISGIPHDEADVEKLLESPVIKVHKETPLPIYRATQITYKNSLILYFAVPKGTEYVYLTSDGRCLQRKDLETVPVSSEHISFSRLEKTSREYDRQFVDGAIINDLDIQLVSAVAEQVSKGMSVEKCLQHLGLADFDGTNLKLRKAALLLFAKEPFRWHPRLQVRTLTVDGDTILSGEEYNILKDEEVNNNIMELIENSWEVIRPHLTETRLSKDALFKTQIIYPELACREALINAIAHRDYSDEGRGIEVKIFMDRLEITSPGNLLSTIKLEDIKQLKGVHQSRNSLVAKVLREMGYMRELGEGIKRIYDLMNRNDLEPPDFLTNRTSFSIILHHKYVYSQEVRIWLENFKKFDLTREEKTVVRLGYGGQEISPSDIWEAVGIVDTDYYRQLLESLKMKGILTRSIDRRKSYFIAKNRSISRKKIPQFKITLPEIPTKKIKPVDDISEQSDYATIFVGNMPFEATESDLEKAFSEFGYVDNVTIPIDYWTGKGRGFAFVEFQNLKSATKALNYTQSVKLLGRNLYTQKYKPK
jgi:ATP-dependent DNA helicase RecG